MSFTIRQAVEADLPVILRLWREMMDFHARVDAHFAALPAPAGERAWEKHVRQDMWGKENWRILVAEADGELIGLMIGTVGDALPVFAPAKQGFVSDAVVAPAARRSGVGRALFEALKAWFREKGASHLELNVAHHNPVSQAFWRAVGCADHMDILWYEMEAE